MSEKLAASAAKRTDGAELGRVRDAALVGFGRWLDNQLAELEAKHGGFVTQVSLKRHFGKGRHA